MQIVESILDFPQESLNPAIWVKMPNGEYALRDDAIDKIQ